MCEELEEPYKPNKYTRYISYEDWRRAMLSSPGESVPVRMVDPGYKNEPGEEPWK